MAGNKTASEKVQTEVIETIPGQEQEVSSSNSLDGAVTPTQGDDLPETVSISIIMAIVVSPGPFLQVSPLSSSQYKLT